MSCLDCIYHSIANTGSHYCKYWNTFIYVLVACEKYKKRYDVRDVEIDRRYMEKDKGVRRKSKKVSRRA
jgi:hypothetical protein